MGSPMRTPASDSAAICRSGINGEASSQPRCLVAPPPGLQPRFAGRHPVGRRTVSPKLGGIPQRTLPTC
ncbi:MAG: hypothetical protein QOJ19_3846 [Acidimicrobiia bacterium]|nr:hypothetical protein [Acidimicrobiia bacterium]